MLLVVVKHTYAHSSMTFPLQAELITLLPFAKSLDALTAVEVRERVVTLPHTLCPSCIHHLASCRGGVRGQLDEAA